MKEDKNDKLFFDRPFEEVVDGYYDEYNFYHTPNGSFWDDELNYFNHEGFDKNDGFYDKFYVYHPGKNYDEKSNLYSNEKDFISSPGINEDELNKINLRLIENLKKQKKIDDNVTKKYSVLEESSEFSDKDNDFLSEYDNEDNLNKELKDNNISYDSDDIKEAYEDVI